MRHILRRGETHLDFIDLLRNRFETLHYLLIIVYLQWIYMGVGSKRVQRTFEIDPD